MRTQGSRSIHKRTTYILENTGQRETRSSKHREIENEKYTPSGEEKDTEKSGQQRKHRAKGHAPPGEQNGVSNQSGERKLQLAGESHSRPGVRQGSNRSGQ